MVEIRVIILARSTMTRRRRRFCTRLLSLRGNVS
jgi:hypothetical protein